MNGILCVVERDLVEGLASKLSCWEVCYLIQGFGVSDGTDCKGKFVICEIGPAYINKNWIDCIWTDAAAHTPQALCECSQKQNQ